MGVRLVSQSLGWLSPALVLQMGSVSVMSPGGSCWTWAGGICAGTGAPGSVCSGAVAGVATAGVAACVGLCVGSSLGPPRASAAAVARMTMAVMSFLVMSLSLGVGWLGLALAGQSGWRELWLLCPACAGAPARRSEWSWMVLTRGANGSVVTPMDQRAEQVGLVV